ncbi:hypothetical protein A4X09_0g6914 [Tilletia walkeri]|uniref:Uncharacterized protein n=1 Tax=Tilletia walkeri TaxID=117179 RepID=A0A8X7N2T7_9BASI|nr:hypothetical protein A4X09_0g6914 [Tilletia walkeri]
MSASSDNGSHITVSDELEQSLRYDPISDDDEIISLPRASQLRTGGSQPAAQPASRKEKYRTYLENDDQDEFDHDGQSQASGKSRRPIIEKDEEEIGLMGSLALDVTVRCHAPQKRTKGAGAPTKKIALARRLFEVGPEDPFDWFKSSLAAAVQSLCHGYNVGMIKYKDLHLTAKIPKGDVRWRKPIAVDTETAFALFKQELLRASDSFALAAVDVNELPPPVEAQENQSGPSATTRTGTKRKASKAESLTTAKGGRISKEEKVTQELESFWECRRPNCRPGGLCIEDDDGFHYELDDELKRRFLAAIIHAKSATVKRPPSTLFDVAKKRRKANTSASLTAAPRASQATPRTPPTVTKAGDVTVTIQNTPPSNSNSSGRRHRSDHLFNDGAKPQTRFKRSLVLPLKLGPSMLIKQGADAVKMHSATVESLDAAEFTTVEQLAKAYENNFDSLVKDAKLTVGKLTAVETLLQFWSSGGSEMNKREGNQDFGSQIPQGDYSSPEMPHHYQVRNGASHATAYNNDAPQATAYNSRAFLSTRMSGAHPHAYMHQDHRHYSPQMSAAYNVPFETRNMPMSPGRFSGGKGPAFSFGNDAGDNSEYDRINSFPASSGAVHRQGNQSARHGGADSLSPAPDWTSSAYTHSSNSESFSPSSSRWIPTGLPFQDYRSVPYDGRAGSKHARPFQPAQDQSPLQHCLPQVDPASSFHAPPAHSPAQHHARPFQLPPLHALASHHASSFHAPPAHSPIQNQDSSFKAQTAYSPTAYSPIQNHYGHQDHQESQAELSFQASQAELSVQPSPVYSPIQTHYDSQSQA